MTSLPPPGPRLADRLACTAIRLAIRRLPRRLRPRYRAEWFQELRAARTEPAALLLWWAFGLLVQADGVTAAWDLEPPPRPRRLTAGVVPHVAAILLMVAMWLSLSALPHPIINP